jgi:hypothetical protein
LQKRFTEVSDSTVALPSRVQLMKRKTEEDQNEKSARRTRRENQSVRFEGSEGTR